MICVACWIIVLIWWPALVVLPVRRADPTRCFSCGYSLVGNVSGVCPECGTPRAAAGSANWHDDRAAARSAAMARRLFIPAAAVFALALLVHGSFVVVHLRYIVHPGQSPLGRHSALDVAGEPYLLWGLTGPGCLSAASALAAGVAVVRAHRRGRPGYRPALAMWLANLVFFHYLIVTSFWWFSD